MALRYSASSFRNTKLSRVIHHGIVSRRMPLSCAYRLPAGLERTNRQRIGGVSFYCLRVHSSFLPITVRPRSDTSTIVTVTSRGHCSFTLSITQCSDAAPQGECRVPTLSTALSYLADKFSLADLVPVRLLIQALSACWIFSPRISRSRTLFSEAIKCSHSEPQNLYANIDTRFSESRLLIRS